MNAQPPERHAERVTVAGCVQAVGFRPFVHALATQLGLVGEVRNRAGQVVIDIEGETTAIDGFCVRLIDDAPSLARPTLASRERIPPAGIEAFSIGRSVAQGPAEVHLPHDLDVCPDCRAELNDPGNRRFGHPFINCTQCGPRYTIIESLPYDRQATSMAAFAMCPRCAAEYSAPSNRRFHAEPLACPDCGPQLEYKSPGHAITGSAAALAAAVDALRRGRIVAVRGVGGYHLLCDARDASVVARLRVRKGRPHKPFAVVFAEDDPELARSVDLDACALAALHSRARPIVLVPARAGSRLAPAVAPGLSEIGVMLPSNPLQHLLVSRYGGPLIATSANFSGEPILTEPDEVERRLGRVADGFLHHDRRIVRPADDPVVRPVAGRVRAIRLGRGNAPLELELPAPLACPTLAVGGHLKSSVALGFGRRVVISPHIGDLGSPRSAATFESTIDAFARLYRVAPERVICDLHPDYASSRWGVASGLPLVRVQHHHAHASALAGEHPQTGDRLVFAFDGVGLGCDGTLWGGEALVGAAGRWQRYASLRPVRIPGAERAGREPWRSAAAVCWATGATFDAAQFDSALAHQAWERGLNTATSSAAGRLFDAAAALVLGIEATSFEGQAPMQLAAIASRDAAPLKLPVNAVDECLRIDWGPLIGMLRDRSRPASERAGCFHASLAGAIVDVATLAREAHGVTRVGLSGGVFQNRLLVELAQTALAAAGFAVELSAAVPANDAGLSFGQLVETVALDG